MTVKNRSLKSKKNYYNILYFNKQNMENMKIVMMEDTINLEELKKYRFWELVNGVIDIELWTLILWWELHSEGEQNLLELWSNKKNLWGIVLYVEQYRTDEFVLFDSLINIKPDVNSMSFIEDENVRTKIGEMVKLLIKE